MQTARTRDYRAYLKQELEKRAGSRPGYSLRAFARDLKMTPQFLSLVLNGKKSVSGDRAAEMAERLRLSPTDATYFVDLVSLDASKSAAAKRLVEFRLREHESRDPGYRSLQEDVFKIISDWYHAAILELTFVEGFKAEPRWIAKRLGISVHEASQAVERLKHFELLDEAGGTLKKTEVNLTTTHDVPSASLRKFNKQILEKAVIAIDEQDVEERDFGTMTLAIDPEKLPEAKRMIRDFRRKFTRSLESGSRREVYVLSSQFFRLSQKENSK